MKEKQFKDVIIDAIQDKKGSSVCTIDLSSIPTSPAPGFIICQGKTPSQTSAIADNIILKAQQDQGRKPARVDGMRNGQWIIIDYGELMIHVFTPEYREFYNLEDLWVDGNIVRVPDID